MSWNLTTSAAAISKAGLHSNAAVIADATTLDKWVDDAEAWLEQVTNTAWVANAGTLSTSVAAALSDVTSSKIAMNIVAYDPTGYLTREADMLMNWNDDIVNKGLAALKGKADKLKTP